MFVKCKYANKKLINIIFYSIILNIIYNFIFIKIFIKFYNDFNNIVTIPIKSEKTKSNFLNNQ